jgi:hypothetical protein
MHSGRGEVQKNAAAESGRAQGYVTPQLSVETKVARPTQCGASRASIAPYGIHARSDAGLWRQAVLASSTTL